MPTPHTSFRTLVFRGLRLRCPRCGKGKLYASWLKMNPACGECNLNIQRDGGFYLGAIYVNYGLTAVLMTALYFWGYSRGIPDGLLLGSLLVFCVIFPLLVFRHARGVWLAFDQRWDPQEYYEQEADAIRQEAKERMTNDEARMTNE